MNRDARTALSVTAHRPWPLQERPWIMFQGWRDLLFAHWPVRATELAGKIPAPLQLDRFDGTAWLGIVALRITGARMRGLPPIPGTAGALELNVRTYVRHEGRPGVYFLSLDSTNFTHVLGARLLRLPYFPAKIRLRRDAELLSFDSMRRSEHGAQFRAIYSPAGPVFDAAPGSLEEFLTERYALYTASRRRLHRLDIQHPPWTLQPCNGEAFDRSVAAAVGVKLPRIRPLLHYAARQDVVFWAPRAVASRRAAVLRPARTSP